MASVRNLQMVDDTRGGMKIKRTHWWHAYCRGVCIAGREIVSSDKQYLKTDSAHTCPAGNLSPHQARCLLQKCCCSGPLPLPSPVVCWKSDPATNDLRYSFQTIVLKWKRSLLLLHASAIESLHASESCLLQHQVLQQVLLLDSSSEITYP